MIPDKSSLERISATAVVESNLEWILGDDLELVRQRIQQACRSAYPLLDDLIAAHLHTHYPRAIIVLGTSRLGHTERSQRVALAAAIELLHLAMNVHDAIPRGEVERSERNRLLLGAAILVGDFCFSQASRLAAETESPAVVTAFADALARLSEQRVRHLLEAPQEAHRDDAVLYVAAAEAAALLVGLPRPIRYALREAAAAFGEVLTDSETALAEAIARLDALLSDRPVARPLMNWLRSRRPV
ncbi:MAG: polyprenyl synthetase family protein [Caldilineales bacterium]|nr:polyprenyl synthetase family protein [Caldilineales bacterium]